MRAIGKGAGMFDVSKFLQDAMQYVFNSRRFDLQEEVWLAKWQAIDLLYGKLKEIER